MIRLERLRTMRQKLYRIIYPIIRLLCKNEYSINDPQTFPSMLSSIPPLQDDQEDVSYDVESLFTNIPIEETINYIMEQSYVFETDF